MSDIIKRADEIVGIATKINLWSRSDQQTYRRGAYCEWILDHWDGLPTALGSTVEALAKMIVEKHAASQPKQPNDGLPPGPWDYMSCPDSNETRIYDRNGKLLGSVRGYDDAARRLAAHIIRSGSAGVRGLFATYEVTDEKQEGSMGLVVGAVHCWTTLEPSPNVVCWLTPRSKP